MPPILVSVCSSCLVLAEMQNWIKFELGLVFFFLTREYHEILLHGKASDLIYLNLPGNASSVISKETLFQF